MTPADLTKLQTYQMFTKHPGESLTVRQLAAFLGWHYQAAYAAVQELAQDLETISGESQFALKTALLKGDGRVLAVDAYRSWLARQNLNYQLVDYALRDPLPSATEFMATHYISRPTLLRRLHRINALGAEYGVVISNDLQFEGAEANIRYCLYAFYWWAHRGQYWPFAATTQAKAHTFAECVSIVAPTTFEATQNDLFIGVIFTRVGKHLDLADSPLLAGLRKRINESGRIITNPAPKQIPDEVITLFHYFQLSRPRFDWRKRGQAALRQEVALLADPHCQAVANQLGAVIQQAARHSQALPPDLCANLLRLTFGYALFNGTLPIPDDYVDGTRGYGYDPAVQAGCLQVLADLPNQANNAGYKRGSAMLALQVATLAVPFLRYQDHGDRLLVEVCVPPDSPGYARLVEFLNVVPWTAQRVQARGDLIILDPEATPSLTAQRHPERCYPWWAEAIDMPAYQAGLVAHIMALHTAKFGAAPQVVNLDGHDLDDEADYTAG